MRLLGVDYGHKRIGLAISDPLLIFAQPLDVVDVIDLPSAASRIAEVCREREVSEIVIGLPRNMNGTIGSKAEETRAFAVMLAETAGVPVREWDERLSSARAERSLRETDMSRKKRKERVDAVAAQVILQAFLDFRKRSGA